jgi:uridylate kinase
MKIAIKVGGSIFCPDGKPDKAFAAKFAAALLELSKRHRLLVVVGGGRLARILIEKAGQSVKSESQLHTLGIVASRVNALALIYQLGENVYRGVPKNEEEVRKAFASGKIVVTGGFRPGQTTDAVTLQSAEAIGADLVIKGTDVKGVFDRDPKKHKDAKFLQKIGASYLLRMSEKAGLEPGKNTIFDPVAARIIEKRGIRTIVLDIRDFPNLMKAAEGKPFTGTTIQD